MTDKTMFTELDQYQWYRDIDELEKHSNLNTEDRLLSEVPPAPISLVLTIMEDMASKPEVMAAWGSPYIDGKIADEEWFLLRWFYYYIIYKYGNETKAVDKARSYIIRLAKGVYSGLDDPKLRAALLADDTIYDDGAGPA